MLQKRDLVVLHGCEYLPMLSRRAAQLWCEDGTKQITDKKAAIPRDKAIPILVIGIVLGMANILGPPAIFPDCAYGQPTLSGSVPSALLLYYSGQPLAK